MSRRPIAQGDVLFVPITVLPAGLRESPPVAGRVVVAHSETGHDHFIEVVCGTGRWFTIPCPPDMPTALAANAWTYGVEGDVLRALAVRT